MVTANNSTARQRWYGPALLSLASDLPGAAGMPKNESILQLVNCPAAPPVVFSPHALSRLRLMGLGQREVRQVVSEPEVIRPNTRGYDQGSYIAVGGRLAVVVAREPRVVLSVLWRWASGRDESGQPCGSRLAGWTLLSPASAHPGEAVLQA